VGCRSDADSQMTIEINGMAHVILTVTRFEVAREFYRKLLPEFGMKPVFDGDKLFYCVGARTAIGIEPCDPALAGERFVQQRVGLHHFCLRARSREDVDRCAALLKEMNATIVRGPQEGTWAISGTLSDCAAVDCRPGRRSAVDYLAPCSSV
jgi:catechol 2,3-dioxygenase-like lactoylglutathione lyase family enzyme